MASSLPHVERVRSAAAAAHTASQSSQRTVLFVPTAARDRAAARERMVKSGAAVDLAADVPEAVELLQGGRYDLVVLDLAAERLGLAAVKLFRSHCPHIPLVGLVDPAHPLVAAEAIPAGVTDLLSWPFDEREFIEVVSNLRDRATLAQSVAASAASTPEVVIAISSAMREALESARAVAERPDCAAIVCGERGSGRALLARTLHRLTGPPERPFIAVDCSSDQPDELERALFGIPPDRRSEQIKNPGMERVGASGAIVRARGGTLYLINLAEAPARTQAKLTRLLRDREAYLEEHREPIALDGRPVAAFGPDLDEVLSEARLRRDLFDRLAQTRIDVPPLRRRREDLPVLAVHLLNQACDAKRTSTKSFSRAALALVTALPWAGNGTELGELIGILVGAVPHPVIQLEDVLRYAALDGASPRTDVGLSLREARAMFERECISATLIRHHGRVGDAAKSLGLQRTNLYRKVRQLNVPRSLLSARR